MSTPTKVVMTTAATRSIKNADEFKEEFRKYSDAAVGVYLIPTREPYRAYEALQDVAIQEQMEFKVWSCIKGWMNFPFVGEGREIPKDIRKPMGEGKDAATIDVNKAFEKLFTEQKEGYYVMFYAHPYMEKLAVQQYIKDFARLAIGERKRLIILAPVGTTLPREVEDDIHILDFKLPSHAELLEVYNQLLPVIEEEYRPAFSDDEVDTIVQNAVGMTCVEFETAISLATIELRDKFAENPDEITPNDYIAVVLKHKVEAVKKTDILELTPSVSMSEVGGFDALKSWMAKKAKTFSEEARAFGLVPPKGILCVGPPGAGKSLFAKASAAMFTIPLIKFDISKVFGKFVGESESRVRAALASVDAMAPCVLFIDEIDKGFGGIEGGGGDSGVSKRVLGTFLTWMQERDSTKAPVFVVMTANNVVGLPAELMRKGRLDEIFACTFPNDAERIEILQIHLKKRGHTLPEAELRKVLPHTDKYVGAELENIVADALTEVFDKHGPNGKLSAADLIEQARSTTPLSKSFADKVQFMHEWAKNNAKWASSGVSLDDKEPQKPTSSTGRTLPIRPRVGGPIKSGKNMDF